MEEEKRKKIEAKLFQLIAQANQPDKANTEPQGTSAATHVIRRRKGQPDLKIT